MSSRSPQKAASLRPPAESSWFVPGEERWECWRCGAGGELTLAQRFEEGAPLPTPTRAPWALALPVQAVYSAPLLSNAPDAVGMAGTVRLQMERLGLLTREEPEGLAIHPIEKRGAQTLVRAETLVSGLPGVPGTGSRPPERVLSSPHLLPFPPQAWIFWRELGRLVLAITSSKGLLHVDVLSSRHLDAAAVGEARRLTVNLAARGLIEVLREVVLWTGEARPQDVQTWSGLPTREESRPAPRRPAGIALGGGDGSLEPLRIAAQRAAIEAGRRRRRVLLGMALSLGLIALAFTGLIGWESRVGEQWRERYTSLKPQAARMEEYQRQWAEAAPAIDPEASVLELWLGVALLPSAGQVQITRWETGRDSARIEGVAESAPVALRFLDEVGQSPALQRYHWEFPQPTIQAEGSATFELNGQR